MIRSKGNLLPLMFFLFFGLNCMGQNRDNYWALGYFSFTPFPQQGGSAITFNGGIPNVSVYDRELNMDWTNASISDSLGNLLFYTNGVYIANAQDDTMLNGSGLNPSWYTNAWYNDGLRLPQADVIIPKPGNDSLYFLFHETLDFTNLGVFSPNFCYLSIINLNGDSAKGEVISKNQTIIYDTLFGGSLTACKHANGRDWWLLVPEWGTNIGFYSMLITPDTVAEINHQYFPVDGLQGGQACFSPDGSKYIFNNWFEMDFYNFDRCSGNLTLIDDTIFADGHGWIGASVSPNSRYAYISHGDSIFQFDLLAADITASVQVVAVRDTFQGPLPTKFLMHQLAPDGKIYISTGSSTYYLHCIDQPDSAGLACNVLQHSIDLTRYNVSIPNFPNYNLGPLLGSVCDSLGLGVAENASNSFNIGIKPNPCRNYFYINYDIPTNKNLLFILYNDLGKEILRKKLYGSTKDLLISTQGLINAVYFGVVSDGVKKAMVKVVVIN